MEEMEYNRAMAIKSSTSTATLVLGIALLTIGFLVLFFPGVTTIFVTYLIGILIFVAGIIMLVNVFSPISTRRKFVSLFSGIVTTVVGVFVIINPIFGLVLLTLLIGAYLVIDGLIRIGTSLTNRDTSGWYLTTTTGAIALVLGILIFLGLPESSLWVIGLFLGLYFVIIGISTLFFGAEIPKIPKPTAAPT